MGGEGEAAVRREDVELQHAQTEETRRHDDGEERHQQPVDKLTACTRHLTHDQPTLQTHDKLKVQRINDISY